jgi:hypothetical protein
VTAPGHTAEDAFDARCPAGTRLLGGGGTSDDPAAYLFTSGPYQDSTGQRFEIWNAGWLVRSDAGAGETVHVHVYAYCANVGS